MRTAARVPLSSLSTRRNLGALMLLSLLAGGLYQQARAEGLQLAPLETKSLRWQTRVQLSSLDDRSGGHSLLSANLLGDYYLTSSAPNANFQGGLRTTGGLLVGSAAMTESSGGLALRPPTSRGLAIGQRHLSSFGPTLPATDGGLSTRPYLGIGYTGQSLRGGWGFSADLGLVKSGSRDELRLGRGPQGAQSLEELLLDMRFRPVLQLGLNYSF
ncbi:hypothetical protein G8A07_06270 [Roseateles sp. DAIF2]|uniref:hypothetical protein n=1 Tax=Roseateles sp. DAIF2 TaxID=2714952 RepID=UPI0018A33408|nr:hypothetical protein [Roseateles sp. DAIF2]QPF72574.1 hypothetical protein G8A07_06270 [Roseateles sp. DAIF2]